VVEVPEVLLLLVGVRRERLGAGQDLHAAEATRALADARGLDLDARGARAGVEERRALGALDGQPRRLEGDAGHYGRFPDTAGCPAIVKRRGRAAHGPA